MAESTEPLAGTMWLCSQTRGCKAWQMSNGWKFEVLSSSSWELLLAFDTQSCFAWDLELGPGRP